VRADRACPLIATEVLEFVEGVIGGPASVNEIAGDASTRRFYRASTGRKTGVLVIHPEPLPPAAPLYSNHRILEAIGAPVPKILGADHALGAVLMEDCGDVTLQKRLSGKPAGPVGDAVRLYREACDLIVLFQKKGARALLPGDFAATNALDRERFLFELDHFHRHFIEGLRRLRPGESDAAMLRAFYDDLSEACDRMPRVYCHRDFQSRNLLVRRGRLRVIDFQDARMGPYTYDAASLLRDSSLDLDEALVQEMIDHLIRLLGADPEEFRRDFDLMALQRNIKDLGTFAYLATVLGRRSYLEYVPRTIRSVRATLVGDRRFHFVYPALDRHILGYEG
jgi:hypothetical protein